MSDALDRGFTVAEMAPMGQPIPAPGETTAAFIGRALRGPLDVPVLLRSFGDFRRRFGDVWLRSGLGPAAQQFFEHGGRRLYIVRVANGARGALLCLPASGSALVLRALEPGSTERIRAAVDYDGIAANNDELFNLTLQRIDPLSGLVSDQEIYSKASFRQGRHNYIVDLLLSSALARVEAPLPTHRPEPTAERNAGFAAAYVQHAQDGTDGHELSDYDLIGSRKKRTGLFALQQLDQIDLLYLPPPGRGRDLGPASVLAAERFCRDIGAMLIVDPRAEWVTPDASIDGMRRLGLASANMVGYFPRMWHRDDETRSPRVVGGAIAGMLCKLDRDSGAWHALGDRTTALQRNLLPAVDVDADAVLAMAREGLNTIRRAPFGAALLAGNVTMARGLESHREFASLPVRRFCLQMVNAIRQATRWAVFEDADGRLQARVQNQVSAYLSSLADMGAFERDQYFVNCVTGLGPHEDRSRHGIAIMIAMQPVGCTEPVSITLHQTVAGCRVASTAFAPGDGH